MLATEYQRHGLAIQFLQSLLLNGSGFTSILVNQIFAPFSDCVAIHALVRMNFLYF